ncbi:type II secretion system protein GspF [Desulfonema ishimotonii]|uniref:General secretion pathway protein F n=1 Tax=Desulfonema ishimotonii TaxID=45657 RepID=A0A401G4A0_9BACT|nr:type II secretion system inner membrane protein GspF [Desulfonema ishimotonii]GBC64067.1 type II secretion system protein GspF [Desulfonema ishimotonii]
MPVYEYTALDAKGKTISGVIDAESAPAARQKLRSSKKYPVSIKETLDAPARKGSRLLTLSGTLTRVKPAEVSLMTRQLATLVGANFPLVSALDTLIPQTKSQGFKKILAQIKDAIVEGNSFAAALSPYSNTFSPLYVNMVRAGESAGTLEIVLERLADITEKQQALNSRIKAALAYPVLMAVIGTLVLFFLLTFIVPSIASIFTDMDKALPTPTQILITVSNFFKSYWWVFIILMAMMGILLRHVRKTPAGRYQWDKAVLRTPGAGALVKKLAVARFARTLGSLLENGVTMLTALDIVRNIVGNVLLADAIDKATDDVGKGHALGASLTESDIFPSLSVQMIQVGEQTGELEPMLNKVADVFENEVESAVMSMTALLEPLMILAMAVIVGFIVLSICLPIFEMNELIR